MKLRQRIKMWLYGSCPGFAGAFPYFGTKVYFPKQSFLFKLACQQGIYEMENLNFILSLIQPETTYFDVGANIGLMSIPVLQKHKTCQVIAFEPSPNTLAHLTRTYKNSQYADRWQIIGKATGSESGILEFFIASPDMGAFDGLRDTKRANTNQKVLIPVTTLDSEWKTLGSPDVSLIKIDIEGAELDALKGAIQCIEKCRSFIILEWNAINLKAYGCSVESILSFAKDMDYILYSLPTLAEIHDVALLRLHMIQTESFLLAPSGEREHGMQNAIENLKGEELL
jgi:FkbM family methyltransferase